MFPLGQIHLSYLVQFELPLEAGAAEHMMAYTAATGVDATAAASYAAAEAAAVGAEAEAGCGLDLS